LYSGRKPRQIHVGLVRMLARRNVGEHWRSFVSYRAEDAAVAAGDHVAAGPGVGLLHVARGEDALLGDEHYADAVPALLVGPNPRHDELGRIDQVLVAVVADHAVQALRRVAADRQRGVDEEIQPVDRLLDARAALGPDGAGIAAARHDFLHRVGDRGELAPAR